MAFRSDSIRGYRLLKHEASSWIKVGLLTLYIGILREMQKFTLKNADLLVFNSLTTKKSVERECAFQCSRKARLIYNNANPKVWSKKAEENAKIEYEFKGKIVLGFVGNLYGVANGIYFLIDAFRQVKRELKDSVLFIIGEGPDLNRLKECAKRLGLEKDVIFTGRVNNPYPYYKRFNLVIFPLIDGGHSFANVILESLYCGTPVIASSHGANVEALKYNELLFNVGDVTGLAEKIVSLFRDREKFEIIRKLCEERRKVFTFDWGERMTGIVKDVCRNWE